MYILQRSAITFHFLSLRINPSLFNFNKEIARLQPFRVFISALGAEKLWVINLGKNSIKKGIRYKFNNATQIMNLPLMIKGICPIFSKHFEI